MLWTRFLERSYIFPRVEIAVLLCGLYRDSPCRGVLIADLTGCVLKDIVCTVSNAVHGNDCNSETFSGTIDCEADRAFWLIDTVSDDEFRLSSKHLRRVASSSDEDERPPN